ncbi:MAG: transglutaminase domain-containing protein [Acidobacteriota bacterium]
MYRCFISLFCLVVLALIGVTKLQADGDSASTQPKQRSFEFTYTASVNIPEGAHSAALWLPVPKSDAYQEITGMRVNSSYPISLYTDPEYNNSILHVAAKAPKAGLFSVEMTIQARRREHINRPNVALKASDADPIDPLMPRWLQPDKLVPINQRIRDLAAEITKGKNTELEKARAIYDYAVTNLKYDKSGAGWGRGDIFFACDEKRGNCTDFHALIIGLCRASNIPARFGMGFTIPNDKPEGQIAGYHCWAELYLNGIGWLPIDASEANKNPDKREYFFGAHDEHRVQFTIGRDIPLRPAHHSDPLNFFIYPYAEINEKPATAEKKFSYKSL